MLYLFLDMDLTLHGLFPLVITGIIALVLGGVIISSLHSRCHGAGPHGNLCCFILGIAAGCIVLVGILWNFSTQLDAQISSSGADTTISPSTPRAGAHTLATPCPTTPSLPDCIDAEFTYPCIQLAPPIIACQPSFPVVRKPVRVTLLTVLTTPIAPSPEPCTICPSQVPCPTLPTVQPCFVSILHLLTK